METIIACAWLIVSILLGLVALIVLFFVTAAVMIRSDLKKRETNPDHPLL